MDVIPGDNEINCVCPRCGTPFVQKLIPEEPSLDESVSADPVPYSEPKADLPSESSAGITKPAVPSSPHVPSVPSGSPDWHQGPVGEPWPHHAGHPRKSNLGAFLLVLVGFFIILYGVWTCTRSADTSAVIPSSGDAPIATTTNSDGVVDADTTETDSFREVRPQRAPDWIQGKWTVKASYGLVTLFIHGDKITEIISYSDGDGKESTEANDEFYYQDGVIYCKNRGDHGDLPMSYRLDMTHHKVIFGADGEMDKQ